MVADAAEADVVVVNTCGFIDAAREESIEAILEAAQLKNDRSLPAPRRGRLPRAARARGAAARRSPRSTRSSGSTTSRRSSASPPPSSPPRHRKRPRVSGRSPPDLILPRDGPPSPPTPPASRRASRPTASGAAFHPSRARNLALRSRVPAAPRGPASHRLSQDRGRVRQPLRVLRHPGIPGRVPLPAARIDPGGSAGTSPPQAFAS